MVEDSLELGHVQTFVVEGQTGQDDSYVWMTPFSGWRRNTFSLVEVSKMIVLNKEGCKKTYLVWDSNRISCGVETILHIPALLQCGHQYTMNEKTT
jgi:hypothetical protein